MLIPILCAFPSLFFYHYNIEKGLFASLSSRCSARTYIHSYITATAVAMFIITYGAQLISILLSGITFRTTGYSTYGARLSFAYWNNLAPDQSFRFQSLYIAHPVIYNLLFALLFSGFCAFLTAVFSSMAILLKRKAHLVLIFSAFISFVFSELFGYFDYSIWIDVTPSRTFLQSGLPTLIFIFIFAAAGLLSLHYGGKRCKI